MAPNAAPGFKPGRLYQIRHRMYNGGMQSAIATALAGLPLGRVEFFPSVGSTNDVVSGWLDSGAADLSLAVADEQTAGRGRAGRRWYTPAGAALAFSVLLLPRGGDSSTQIGRYSGLGALAVHSALTELGLQALIKWPNDVLIDGAKVCGVLAEARWQGERPAAVILGIGLNLRRAALPDAPLNFPATCIEAHLDPPPERWPLLGRILEQLLVWRAKIDSPDFLKAWQERLAYRDRQVQLTSEGAAPITGTLVGLAPDGRLSLRLASGEVRLISAGEVQLRVTDDPSSVTD